MPKKNKKQKNHPVSVVRKLVEKDDDTEYGLVTKKLGDGRFTVRLNLQNKEVIGRLCGKFRHGGAKKSNWVDINSVVLVGLRDYQDNIVDIVNVYTSDEVRQLKKSGAFVEESVRDDDDDQTDLDPPQEEFDFGEI